MIKMHRSQEFKNWKCPYKAPGDQVQSKKLHSEPGPQEPYSSFLNTLYGLSSCVFSKLGEKSGNQIWKQTA
jgi:hypothetical protein